MKVRAAITALFAGLSLGGCFPVKQDLVRAVQTAIVDADTRAPVEGARVTLADGPEFAARTSVGMVTGPDGLVKLGPIVITSWCPPAPCDVLTKPGFLRVEASGYQTIEGARLSELPLDEQRETVMLKRLAGQPPAH